MKVLHENIQTLISLMGTLQSKMDIAIRIKNWQIRFGQKPVRNDMIASGFGADLHLMWVATIKLTDDVAVSGRRVVEHGSGLTLLRAGRRGQLRAGGGGGGRVLPQVLVLLAAVRVARP